MAKTQTRRKKSSRRPASRFSRQVPSEAVGIVLLVLALLTLLSLVSANRGSIIRWWVDALYLVAGPAAWATPVLFALIGASLVWRRMAGQDRLQLRRPVGVLILFLVIAASLHIAASAPDPKALALERGGGGMLGWIVSEGLLRGLGVAGAVLVLVLATLGGAFLVWGIAPEDFWERVQKATASASERRASIAEQPPLPIDREPFWSRWLDRLRSSGQQFLTPPPTPRTPSPRTSGRRSIVTTKPTPRSTGRREPIAVPSYLPDGQPWDLPLVDDILEDTTTKEISQEDVRQKARTIEDTLASFGVPVQVVEVNPGPAVTQFGLKPGSIPRRSRDGTIRQSRVKVSQISRLSDDLALALAASPIRIETPVPGRDVVCIEVPNTTLSMVSLGSVMRSETFTSSTGTLRIALGRAVSGAPAVADLALMPHLLIAGATGSGKSVCINSLVACLLCTHTPQTLKFLMIDPKMVELAMFNGIPHLIGPVVVDLDRVVGVLRWATAEMDRRLKLFNKEGVRHLDGYNHELAKRGETILPYIIVVIDELADLMMVAAEDVERYICRIAQMARATGIHLVVATQRPSVDVVTGLIKANFPARVAFAVTSQIDSRVILDTPGAEKLLGRGDMLLMTSDSAKLARLQGCFVSDRELRRLVNYWKGASDRHRKDRIESGDSSQAEPMVQQPLWEEMIQKEEEAAQRDELFDEAVRIVRESKRASISYLQRRLSIGYNRAGRLIDNLEAVGIIGPAQTGGRGREVLTYEHDESGESGTDETESVAGEQAA